MARKQPNIFGSIDDNTATTVLLSYVYDCYVSNNTKNIATTMLKFTYKQCNVKAPAIKSMQVVNNSGLAPVVLYVNKGRRADVIMYISQLPEQLSSMGIMPTEDTVKVEGRKKADQLDEQSPAMQQYISTVSAVVEPLLTTRKKPAIDRCIFVLVNNDDNSSCSVCHVVNMAKLYKCISRFNNAVIKDYCSIYKVKGNSIVRK